MALRASCPHCKKSFSSPEEYRGRKIDCPSCKRRFVVKTEEELEAAEEEERLALRRKDEDREKLALIERIESRGGKKPGKPYYEEFQTGADEVRHFNPRATSRFLRFRNLSDFLVLGAYVELFLVAVGVGLIVYLKIAGFVASMAVLFTLIVAWLVVGVGLYLFFKYLGELAFLLADVGDQQNDVVQLLLDIRENTDGEGKAEAEAE